MTVYKEKYGTRRDTDNALRRSTAQLTWTDVPWNEGLEIPRAQLWAPHPDFPMLVCVRRRRKGIGQPNSRGQYEKCEVTAYYELVTGGGGPDDPPITETIINVESGAEAITAGGLALTWSSDSEEVGQNISLMVPVSFISVRHNVSNLPLDTIGNLMGKINNATVQIRNKSFAANTLRFDGANSQDVVGADGTVYWENTYRFAYNYRGWQYLPRVVANAIDWQTTTQPIYKTGNFAGLL